MGEHERWAQPAIGLLPNGLLPNEAASVIRALNMERWMKAEERTAELIGRIQPNPPSEELRNAVADYVQRLIMKCFSCQVFTFGSVPLKTYLPDGDIDLTAFSNNQSIKDKWAHQVRDMLESEEKNENAEFRVKEVQYIQAEVRIIKCLVENIVVDISFNQLGGLCTLCFLEEVDHLIDQNHLFKRSIILIKAWCYYESRILGAHHGLISTYALETLVLYIFHVFNNSFTGPLEVLYRFLEFFSKFDWENFCVSLWGPVPISSLPDVTAEPPRKDGGELLLSKLFLDACSSVYAVFPSGPENQGQPFVSKHFNVIDPLRINNNLGRSVSKGNFFRIRSAFAFGARKLARLFDCPKEDLCYEVNQFFMNTWERHGSGNRPDVLKIDLCPMQSSNLDHADVTENVRSTSNSKRESSSHCGTLADDLLQAHNIPFEQGSHPGERTRAADSSAVPHIQSQKIYVNSNNRRIYGQIRQDGNSSQKAQNDKSRSSRPGNLLNEIHGRYLFARTRSSPELTDNYAEVSGRLNIGNPQASSTNLDMTISKNTESDRTPGNSNRSSTDDSSVRLASLHQAMDAAASTVVQLSRNPSDLVLGGMAAEFPSFAGTQGMHQEEQDLVNMMVSSAAHAFNGQVHVPLNMASNEQPLPITSVLASMGYASRNFGGFFPANLPLVEASWSTTMHFSQSLASPQLAQCFAGIGLATNVEDSTERSFENFGPTGANPGEREHGIWREQDGGSTTGLDLDNGSFETLQSDTMHNAMPSGYNFVPSLRGSNSGTSTRAGELLSKEKREDLQEDSQYQDFRTDNLYVDERARSSRSTHASKNTSLRSKTSAESSWEIPSAEVSKPLREKRGRRNTSGQQATAHLKGKSMPEHSSQTDYDSRELNLQSTIGSEMAEKNSVSQLISSLHLTGHQMPGFGQGQTNGSVTDSLMPIAPVMLGPGSQQKASDGSGVVPFAFYPTGPPVPFVTMLPLYNFPAETRPSDNPSSHFDGDDCLDQSLSGPNFDTSDRNEQSDVFSTSTTTGLASVEQSEQKADILNGDFASHWKNLQYGRYCQNSRYPVPSLYPSPVMVPPVYVQGRFPFDGPGKPVSANSSHSTQLMSSGPYFVPVAPPRSVSNRPAASLFQRYIDEMPRYRVGTGTYLPNPKVSARERYPASGRRGSYTYDRSDQCGDRDGNWNINSKPRATARNHNRIHTEKASSRLDRSAASENRADRPWSSHRHDSLSSNRFHSSRVIANTGQSGPSNIDYSMYPLPSTNPSGMSSNGPTIPSVVMFYPYDNSTVYHSPAEQLEFGSLGPLCFSSISEVSQLSEGTRSGGVYDEQRLHGVSAQQASLDKAFSPHLRR